MASKLCVLLSTLVVAATASAQDMEPRAYSASPVGLNFLVVGYGWLSGSVLLDPTLPISDVHANLSGPLVGLGCTFDLFGNTTLLTAVAPYSMARVTGQVFEQAAEVRRSGLADARIKLSTNLRGNPAMSAREFLLMPSRTVIGTSLTVSVPTGQYYERKLINLGSNRWVFKPEVGLAMPIGRWHVDVYGGAAFSTSNDRFYPGDARRTQRLVGSLQVHASYEFKPRLWVAVDATAYRGGTTQVDEGPESPGLNNSRLGATVSVPVSRYQVKVAYSSGVTTRFGGNFRTVTAAWQVAWLK